MEDQSNCSHPNPSLFYNNNNHLAFDGTTEHEKIVCQKCEMIWRPGDTKTHLAEHPFRFAKDIPSVENPTGLSWEDMKSLFRADVNVDGLALLAGTSALIN
jgi:hypothetical protein